MIAVNSSINGYKKEIELRQARHLPRNTTHEMMGILSYQTIHVLHFGHDERGLMIDCPQMRRYATTFKKEPQQRKNGIKK